MRWRNRNPRKRDRVSPSYNTRSRDQKSLLSLVIRYVIVFAFARWVIKTLIGLVSLVAIWWWLFGIDAVFELPSLALRHVGLVLQKMKFVVELFSGKS